MKPSSLILPFVILLLISCDKQSIVEPEKEDVVIKKDYPNADQRLWPHFEAFELAAQKRGKTFDLKELNILGVIVDINEAGVAGHCKYGSHIDNEVTIDSEFWSRTSSLYKEFIVFHELGHCVLLRGHDETIFNDGTCESLMRSGAQDCKDNYNDQTKTRYLDELFLR